MMVLMLSLSYSIVTIFVITFAPIPLCYIITIGIEEYPHLVLAVEEDNNVNNNNSISNPDSISDNRFNYIISNTSEKYRLSEQSSSPSTTTLGSGIGVDTYPVGISVNPSTKKIYVANEFSNTVSVVDIPTLKVEKSISVENFPYALDSNVLNNRVYVTNRGSNSVSVIDGSTNSILYNISVEKSPVGISVNPSASWIYVTNLQ
jgi:YVTN family beta-propeller protein